MTGVNTMTNESVCVCVCVCLYKSLAMLHDFVWKLCAFLLQATPTATPPFLPVGPNS